MEAEEKKEAFYVTPKAGRESSTAKYGADYDAKKNLVNKMLLASPSSTRIEAVVKLDMKLGKIWIPMVTLPLMSKFQCAS